MKITRYYGSAYGWLIICVKRAVILRLKFMVTVAWLPFNESTPAGGGTPVSCDAFITCRLRFHTVQQHQYTRCTPIVKCQIHTPPVLSSHPGDRKGKGTAARKFAA